MDYMGKVAEMFDLELGETFGIEEFIGGSFKFIESGIKVRGARISNHDILMRLLIGEAHIVKKPFCPKLGEKYYFLSDFGGTIGGKKVDIISSTNYTNNVIDLCNLSLGNCFKSREGITKVEIKRVKNRLEDKF